MTIVYVSGKYRDTCHYNVLQNIYAAERVAAKWWVKPGHAVITPHKNSAWLDGLVEDQVWLDGDLELVRRSDVVVMVNNWERSEGARAEHALAVELGKEIHYDDGA